MTGRPLVQSQSFISDQSDADLRMESIGMDSEWSTVTDSEMEEGAYSDECFCPDEDSYWSVIITRPAYTHIFHKGKRKGTAWQPVRPPMQSRQLRVNIP